MTWCRSSAPSTKTYKTASNKALVKFNSGEGDTSKGFLIEFETNCGYSVSTEGTGMIRLRDSSPSKVCEWIISSPNPLDRIKFSINHFSGNTSNFHDVLAFDPAIDRSKQFNTYYAMGSTLKVMLTVNGPTVFEASYSVFENCKLISDYQALLSY